MMGRKFHNRFSAEFRDRAVRTVLEEEGRHPSRWAAVVSIAPRLGCAKQTLDKWVRQSATQLQPSPASADQDLSRQLKVLERENRKLRRINEILRKASAYFALAQLER